MTCFVRDKHGHVFREDKPRPHSYLRADGVRVYDYERDEDYDVLVSFLESEPWADDARSVIDEIRHGRTASWHEAGNAHSLQITPSGAEILHEPFGYRLRLSLDELADGLREWNKFDREETERNKLLLDAVVRGEGERDAQAIELEVGRRAMPSELTVLDELGLLERQRLVDRVKRAEHPSFVGWAITQVGRDWLAYETSPGDIAQH